MCTYCMIGDFQFQYNPPFAVPGNPLVPQPFTPGPHKDWDLAQLVQFQDLLRRVKELEDKLGCPCEPNKADYLKLIQERIERMEEMG